MTNDKRRLGIMHDNVASIDAQRPTTDHAKILDNGEAVGRYVVLERKVAEKTAEGLWLPDNVKNALGWCVVSVGPKAVDVAGVPLEVGDRVLIKGGDEMTLGKRTFAFVDPTQIFFRLDKSAHKFFETDIPFADIRVGDF